MLQPQEKKNKLHFTRNICRFLFHFVKDIYVKWIFYTVAMLCIGVMLYLDSHVTLKLSRKFSSRHGVRRNDLLEYGNYFWNYKDRLVLKNPLNNKTFAVRLTLTPEEQWSIASQNVSLREMGLSLPVRKSWSQADKKRTEWRNLDLLGLWNITFNTNYKNPCWRNIHRTMNCLPYFFLIGAPKCGTTDLYKRLIQHPDMVWPAMKEPHWLTRKRVVPSRVDGLRKVIPSLTSYLKVFLNMSLLMYKSSSSEKITGDCSASTLWDNDVWPVLPRNDNPIEPIYTNADYVYKLNKNAKIIVLLRDPVQRLYSDYLYFEKDNSWQSPAIFHNHVVQSVRQFTACMTVFSLRACVYHQEFNKLLKIRLRVSIYYIYLMEWYRRFPPSQILVLSLEDYARNTRTSLLKIFRFLNLRPLDDQVLDKIVNGDRMNARSDSDKNIGSMWPETRQILSDFYKPFNRRLRDLIIRNRF